MHGVQYLSFSHYFTIDIQNPHNHLPGLQGAFYSHGVTLIPAYVSNNMPSKVWDEIISPFPNSGNR